MTIKNLFLKKKPNNELDKKTIRNYNGTRPSDKTKYLCHAPFKSMTFFLDGNVMACWHNKQFLIGQFPVNTIKEIWNGDKIKKLREHILNNNLELGCFECKKNITNGMYSSAGAWRYDYLPEDNSNYPVSMDFQISNVCNNECIMCIGEYSSLIRKCREKKPAYKSPYQLDFLEQLNTFIPFLKEASFSGGEVFLIEEYFEIWEKFIQQNPNIIVSITTNGTVVNERVKNILSKLNFNINISIDSIEKSLFEYIRKNSILDDVLSNLDFFIKYTQEKNTELTVRICVMKQNFHSIPELVTYLNSKNIKIHFNNVIFPPYSALWNFDSIKLAEIITLYSSIVLENKNATQKCNILSVNSLMSQIKHLHDLSLKKEKIFLNLSSHELKNLIITKVKEYISNNICFNIAEKEKFINHITLSIDYCIKEIQNEEILKNAFVFYLQMPINRFVDEINLRKTDNIIEFTRQAGINGK